MLAQLTAEVLSFQKLHRDVCSGLHVIYYSSHYTILHDPLYDFSYHLHLSRFNYVVIMAQQRISLSHCLSTALLRSNLWTSNLHSLSRPFGFIDGWYLPLLIKRVPPSKRCNGNVSTYTLPLHRFYTRHFTKASCEATRNENSWRKTENILIKRIKMFAIRIPFRRSRNINVGNIYLRTTSKTQNLAWAWK